MLEIFQGRGEAYVKDAFSSYPQTRFPRFEEQLQQAMAELSNSEAQVAQYMVLNVDDLSFETGASLADKVGVSEVTVSRLLRRLGYEGMRGLKRELQLEQAEQVLSDATGGPPDANAFSGVMEMELKALRGVFQQCAGADWERLIDTVDAAERVYVTGFQTVRGLAEDCARRMSLARGGVSFLSAHDGMLAEWLEAGTAKGAGLGARGQGARGQGAAGQGDCLLLVDVVPYAMEAPILAAYCKKSGRSIVVVTDELCYWAKDYTDLVIYARSRSGLFLESTVGLTAALNSIVHAVANRDPERTKARLDHWKAMARELNVF